MDGFPNIDPSQNYKRISNGHVFTGRQVLNLLEVAPPEIQAVVLLDIWETDSPATNPNDKYGLSPTPRK